MALQLFRATDFRCLQALELTLDGTANLISGANAAGKTSVLEAIAYLGRGKSFRGAPPQNLIRHGQSEFVVFGRVEQESRVRSVGVRNSAAGLEMNIDGDSGGGAAALAEVLPLQIIEPNVHDLISGGPAQRRRYLDWLAFHVEHGYLNLWRRFRRVLKQRNAALKTSAPGASLDSWDAEFVALAEPLAAARARVVELAQPTLQETGAELLQAGIAFEYRRGWADDQTLSESLRGGRDRDLALGSTQLGPQRAEIRLRYDERQAKRLVSRGQQKLLACSMILAATELAQAALERPLLLLLDDPAAELDKDSLARLMNAVNRLGCQVVAASLLPDTSIFDVQPALFHVEQGRLLRDR